MKTLKPNQNKVEALASKQPGSTNDFIARRTASLQPKLTIGQPNDKYEQEADRVANQVMRMPERGNIQRKCTTCTEEEGKVQKKPLIADITPFVQKQSNGQENRISDSLETNLNSSKSGGSPLPGDTRHFMESRIGADFSHVKVHTDNNAVQMSQELGAQAFAHGNHLYFNSGKYNPSSSEGKHLLAHELVHTVQQGKVGVQQKQFVSLSSKGPKYNYPVTTGSYHRQNQPRKYVEHEKIKVGFWGFTQHSVSPNSSWGKILKQNAERIYTSQDVAGAFQYIVKKISRSKIKHLDIRIFGYSWGGWSTLQLTELLFNYLQIEDQEMNIENFTIKLGLLDPVNTLRFKAFLPEDERVKAFNIFQRNGCVGCLPFSSLYKGEFISGATNKDVSGDGLKIGGNRQDVPLELTPDHIDLGYRAYGKYDSELIGWVLS